MFLRQIFPAAQQQPLLALDELALLPPLAKELRPAHFIDGGIGMLHHVKLVIDDLALWRPLLETEPKWLPHIYARRLEPSPLPAVQFLSEEFIQRFLLALPSEP
jgi:hypothetical protein